VLGEIFPPHRPQIMLPLQPFISDREYLATPDISIIIQGNILFILLNVCDR